MWLCLGQAGAAEAPDCAGRIMRVEVAKDPQGTLTPPKDRWQEVQLPDDWSSRWPDLMGIVWYRFLWKRDCAQPVAFALDYLNMVGVAYVNNRPIWLDANFLEPAAGQWGVPRYRKLFDNDVHMGGNVITVGVISRTDTSKPGLGKALIGPEKDVYRHYRMQQLARLWLPRISVIASSVLALVFLALWLASRQEKAFFWFSISTLLFCSYHAFRAQQLGSFGFLSYEQLRRFIFGMPILFGGSFLMFVLSLIGWRSVPWLRLLAGLVLTEYIAVWVAPEAVLNIAQLLAAYTMIGLYVFSTFLLGRAGMARREDRLFLAIALYIALGVVDMFVVHSGFVQYFWWVAGLSAALALTLIQRFVRNTKRIQRFNLELEQRVRKARNELGQALQQRHALELDNARLAGRLVLARDLHDGLGGHLVSAITRLEQSRTDNNPGRTLALLKALREDLRQLIDTNNAHASSVPKNPKAWLASVRRRNGPLLEEVGVHTSWQVPEAWPWTPTPLQAVSLMRILQEACNNVIKHSRASQLSVTLDTDASNALRLTIEDNGVGFDLAEATGGIGSVGLTSMSDRAKQMGATLQVESTPGGTRIRVLVAPPKTMSVSA